MNPKLSNRPVRLAALAADRLAGLALAALAAGMAWQSLLLPLGSLQDPGAGYLPLALSVLLGAFGVGLAVRPASELTLSALDWTEARHAALLLGACAVAALLLEPLGWRLTCLLLLGMLLGVVERQRWWVALLVAVGLSWGTFYLFATLLKVPLPRGPFQL
jgi:putative tricarboxylic transport membrane protein